MLILRGLAVEEIGVTHLHIARGSAFVNSLFEDGEALLILFEAKYLAEKLTQLQGLVAWGSCRIQSL